VSYNICIYTAGKVRLVGNTKAEPAADIVLSGPGYYQQHAVIKFVDGKMSITPQQGKVCVNGKEVKEKKSLHHNDRYSVYHSDRMAFRSSSGEIGIA